MNKFKYGAILFASLLGLLLVVTSNNETGAQSGNKLDSAVAADSNLDYLQDVITGGGLNELLQYAGPFTILAPTDAAFNNMPADQRQALFSDPQAMKHTGMYHVLKGSYTAEQLAGMASAPNALGQDVQLFDDLSNINIDSTAKLIQSNMHAANGIIHYIDTVLPVRWDNPTGASGDAGTAPPPADNGGEQADQGQEAPQPTAPESARPEMNSRYNLLTVPSLNPSYVHGRRSYQNGISTANGCHGMTFVVKKRMDGVVQVGADGMTNPYRGDTSCNEYRGLLCMMVEGSSPPASNYGEDYGNGWSGAAVRAVGPVQGSELYSLERANQICNDSLAHHGGYWQVAEFHAGNYGQGGWDFWAYGGLELGQRYWARIDDQLANPWDSYGATYGFAGGGDPTAAYIGVEGQDPAYMPGGRKSYGQGMAEGRSICKGMTWVIHKQMDGYVKVGADAVTNPYTGDASCDQYMPVLCTRIEVYGAPGNDFNSTWTGGQYKLSGPVNGYQMNSREAANNICSSTFGQGWRMATWHDGAFSDGRGGWTASGVGSLQTGQRFWVAIHGQPANPWNPTQ